MSKRRARRERGKRKEAAILLARRQDLTWQKLKTKAQKPKKKHVFDLTQIWIDIVGTQPMHVIWPVKFEVNYYDRNTLANNTAEDSQRTSEAEGSSGEEESS